MHDLRLPLWGAVLLVVFFFCMGMWQIALINIGLLVVQVLGKVFFDLDGRLTVFLLAIVILLISWIVGAL